MPHTLNVGSYFHICNQISYIGYYVWIQNDTFEIQIVDKIEKHMRCESAWAYPELFLSTAIFEFDLIWFAVVFDSLSDWREREREYSQFFLWEKYGLNERIGIELTQNKIGKRRAKI